LRETVLAINLPAGTGRFLWALRDADLFHRALKPALGCKSAEEGFAGLKPGAYI
jgi:hypothetical protein